MTTEQYQTDKQALAELLHLLTDKTPFPSYFCNHKERYECSDCGKEHEDYAEIVHTETCDSVKAVADRKRIAELVGFLKSTPPAEQQAMPGAVYADITYGLPWEIEEMRDFADRTHALRVATLQKKHSNFVETVGLVLAAVGYTEEYALQWPKEKGSVTFKRWFDEQMQATPKAALGATEARKQDTELIQQMLDALFSLEGVGTVIQWKDQYELVAPAIDAARKRLENT